MSLLASVFLSLLISSPEHLNQNLSYWLQALDSKSIDIQLTSIKRLQEIKDPQSISSIQRKLEDSEPELRAAAARALGRFPYETALKAMEAKLPTETDSYVRSELNRSIRGLKQTFKKQEEKAAGAKGVSSPSTPESEELDGLGE
jgi:HEAT repeat protein